MGKEIIERACLLNPSGHMRHRKSDGSTVEAWRSFPLTSNEQRVPADPDASCRAEELLEREETFFVDACVGCSYVIAYVRVPVTNNTKSDSTTSQSHLSK
jgi:hypothetical protein